MATITDGVTTITPHLVVEWRSTTPARSVVHPILDRPDPDVTLRTGGLRTGVLRLFFLEQADALAAVELHRQASPFALDAAPESPALSMTYVVAPAGTDLVNHDPAGESWKVDVAYQEVAP